jgi:5-keto 4-deoxyuronate isomerase
MHVKFNNKDNNKKDMKNEEDKATLLWLLKGFDYNYIHQENTKRLTNAYLKRHIEIGQHIAKMDPVVVYSSINKYILNDRMLMQTRIALINIIFETSNMSYIPTEVELEVIKIQNTVITYNPDLIFRNENEDYRMIGLCKQEKSTYRSKAQLRWCESYMKDLNIQID